MKLFCVIFLSVLSLNARSQNVRSITVVELEKRLNNGKDTTFVINFWATWCLPCRKELPHFERFQTEFYGQKVKVILLSADKRSKIKTVAGFVKKLKIQNEVLIADEKKPGDFIHKINDAWSGYLPSTLIVNSSKGQRKFFENEFTYLELVKEYTLLNKQ